MREGRPKLVRCVRVARDTIADVRVREEDKERGGRIRCSGKLLQVPK